MAAEGRKLTKREKIQLVTGIICVLTGAVVIFIMGSRFSEFSSTVKMNGGITIITTFGATGLTIFGFWILLRLLK